MDQDQFQHLSKHLRAAVYGASDGIVTTFAVVAGATGAKLPSAIVLILGISNLVADGLSMGASDFLGERSQRKLKQANHHSDLDFPPVWHTGLITFVAFVVAGALPLLPFTVPFFGLSFAHPFFVSVVATAITLFLVGSLRTSFIKGHWWLNGLEMLLVGSLAATTAYFLGYFVEQLIGFIPSRL